MTRALVLSGGGDYRDPWHPFAETSELIGDILASSGLEVAVSSQVEDSLANLTRADTGLLVINAGNAEEPTPIDAHATEGLLAYVGRGGPLLVMHVAATLFPQWAPWEAIVGGRWVRGTTMHPEFGRAQVMVATDDHFIVAGVPDFSTLDERYSYLRVADGVHPLAFHLHDGLRHPLLWSHRYGGTKVVYDALGHDQRSFAAPEHRRIVERSAQWLLAAE